MRVVIGIHCSYSAGPVHIVGFDSIAVTVESAGGIEAADSVDNFDIVDIAGTAAAAGVAGHFDTADVFELP